MMLAVFVNVNTDMLSC